MDNLFALQGEILLKGIDEVKAQLKEVQGDVKATASTMQEGTGESENFSKGMSTLASAAVAGAVVLAIRKVINVSKELISTYKTASKQQTTLTAVLKATGNQIGATSGELENYAGELQDLTGISDETIMAAEQVLIATQALDKDGLKRATADAADLGVAMGTDAASAARTLAIALQDPAEGLTRLRRSGIAFTETEINQIKAMQEVGDKAGAQAAILDKIESKYKGIAQAVGDTPVGTLDKLHEVWGDIKENLGQAILESIKPALDKLLEVLREVKRITAGYTQEAKDIYNLFVGERIEADPETLVSLFGGAISVTQEKLGGSAAYWKQLSDDELLKMLVGFDSDDLKSAKERIEKERDSIIEEMFAGNVAEFESRLATFGRAIEQAIDRETAIDGDSIEASFLEQVYNIIGTGDEAAALRSKIDQANSLLMLIPDMYDPDNIDEETQAMIDKLEAQIEAWEQELEDILNAGRFIPKDYLADYNKQVGELSLQLLAIDEQIEEARKQGNTGALGYLEKVKEELTETFTTLVNGEQTVEEILDDPKWYERLAEIQGMLSSFASETQRLFNAIAQAITQPFGEAAAAIEADLRELQKDAKAEQDDIKRRYDAGVISYEEYLDKTAEAKKAAKEKEDELNRQKEEANRKAFEANKANSLAQAVINAAQSITSIWAQYGAAPYVAAALTAISAAATGIEIGTIAKQEYVPALARGGITTGETIARIGDNPSGNEAVIPLPQGLQEFVSNVGEAKETGKKLDRLIELTEKQIDVSEKGRVIELDGKRVSRALAPDMDRALGEQYRQTKRGL